MQYETSIISDEIIRHCPKCNEIIHYKDKGSLLRANNKNSVCKNCNYNRPKNLGPFIRNCPFCNKKLEYSRIDIYKISEKQNVLCKSCGQKRRIHPPEFSKKMSSVYKNSSPEMKIKRMGMLGKRHKNSTLEKMRVKKLDRLEKLGISPMEDKGASEFFQYQNEQGYRFIENYPLKEIGYIVDGYDPYKHIICEYDTPYHNKPMRSKKDLIRQNNIIEYFNSISKPLNGFYRVDSETKETKI